MVQIGIVGKPNSGKTTFFCAATLVSAEISNRPFVTIKPNQGTGYVTSACVHTERFAQCNPINSKCINGTRLIPATMLDVAGLVPDAWQGRGLGNQFMNDLMQAKALIHVLDASGSTDAEGNIVERGSYNPADDVRFLEREIACWIRGILMKNWAKISKQAALDEKGPAPALAKQLSGLGISEDDVKAVLKHGKFSERPDEWGEDELLRFSAEVRDASKPMLIAANKIDVQGAEENYKMLKNEFPDYKIVPCCSEAELALRKAERSGVISYLPGARDFEIKGNVSAEQKKALEFIRTNVLARFGSTGIQQAVNKTAFELLDLIVVYPVQDAAKWSSGKGDVLPDAYLLKRGSTAFDLARTIHTDFTERFVAAIDCRAGQKIGKDSALEHSQVVKVQLAH